MKRKISNSSKNAKVMALAIVGIMLATGFFTFSNQRVSTKQAHTLVTDTHVWNAPALHFNRSAANPIISPNNSTWENEEIADSNVIKESDHLSVYYSTFGNALIGMATSPLIYPPTVWTKMATPIDVNGGFGGVRLGCVFKDNGTYYMYYGKPAVSTAVYRATSTNGINFTGDAQVLAPSGNEVTIEDAFVLRETATKWYLYYSYRTATTILPGIRTANSTDGITWTKAGGDVLSTGSSGAWDDKYIEKHQILFTQGKYVMIYEAYGGDQENPWCSGIAYSSTPTGTFTKYASNPFFRGTGVLGTFDSYHVDCPFWFFDSGNTYMIFGGSPMPVYQTYRWCLGVAYTSESIAVWNQSTDRKASTAANWVGGIAPSAGDDTIFDYHSNATCEFDLALSIGSFSMLPGYFGEVTQAASFTTSDFNISAGRWTGSPSFEITDTGNFTKIFGIFTWLTWDSTKLVMTGNHKFLNGGSDGGTGAGTWCGFYSLDFQENTTVTGTFTRSGEGGINIASGKTVTIGPGSGFVWDASSFGMSNTGAINGTGTLYIQILYSVAKAINIPINAPVVVMADPLMYANSQFVMWANMTFGSSLQVVGGGQTGNYTLGFDKGINRTLTVAGRVTTGANGYFVQGISSWILGNLSITLDEGTITYSNMTYPGAVMTGGIVTSWSSNISDPAATVTYSLSGLNPFYDYKVIRNGTAMWTKSGSYFSFTDNGSLASFVVQVSYPTSIGTMVGMIFIFLLLGVAVRPMMFVVELTKRQKPVQVHEVINQVVFIIVASTLIGVIALFI